MSSLIENDLNVKFDEYIELLSELCNAFDAMETDVFALPISTVIRVLVHDTVNSHSLLGQLNRKNIQFLSTDTISDTAPIHLGLVRCINIGVHDGKGGEARYWPHCDARYFPDKSAKKKLSFTDWWSEEKILMSGSCSLTRKDLVLAVANKDGGAHFDKRVEQKYDEFRHSWSGGTSLVGTQSRQSRGYDNIPTRPSIRQIAHELKQTIQEHYYSSCIQ